MKGAISLLVGLVIVGILALVLVPDLVDNAVQKGTDLISSVTGTQPGLCTETPLDYRCTCPSGYQKVGHFSYACQLMPEIPSTYSLPIDSWEEAIRFSYDQMGQIAKCDGDKAFNNPISGSLDESNYGFGVYSGTSKVKCHYFLNIECLQQTGENYGLTVWRVDFDPVTGFVLKRYCNPNFLENCPSDIQFTPVTECYLPADVCGDGECFGTETYETCLKDCPAPGVDRNCCGDGVCAKNRVQYTKCLINGVYQTIWTYDCNGKIDVRPLSDCDGYDVIINGSRQVKSIGQIVYVIETTTNCPQDCQ